VLQYFTESVVNGKTGNDALIIFVMEASFCYFLVSFFRDMHRCSKKAALQKFTFSIQW
jgi:hypothetical protein